MTQADVAQLQRALGNAAIGRLLKAPAPGATHTGPPDRIAAPWVEATGQWAPLQARSESANGLGTPRDAETPNRTGLPDALKAGVERLSGVSLDGVRVHRNSDRPRQLGALAYAQGRDIHLGPGQEKHLPHEAWHVAQQAQGRVKPTLQMAGFAVNDDARLEREADVMGARALAPEATGHDGGLGAQERSVNFGATPIQAVWETRDGDIYSLGEDLTELQHNQAMKYLIDNNYLTNDEVESLNQKQYDFIFHTLSSEEIFAIELLSNQLFTINQNPASEMDNLGHEEDAIVPDAQLEDVAPDDIPEKMNATKNEQLPYMSVFRLIEQTYNTSIARQTATIWKFKGVMTRQGIWNLAKSLNDKLAVATTDTPDASGDAMQLARGPGDSGPATYKGSHGHDYKNVIYLRNSVGIFDFGAPKSKASWTNPVTATSCNLQDSCTKVGAGLMPSGGKINNLSKASRAQHFAIANFLCLGTGKGSASPPRLTWHHLHAKYKMVLVDRMVHSKHGHNGGFYLW